MSTSSKFSSAKDVEAYFAQRGAKLLAIVIDGKDTKINQIPSYTTKVKWQCANNKKHIQTTLFKVIMNNKKDKLLCRSCSAQNKPTQSM